MMKVEHINVKAFVDTDGTETGEVGKIVPITLIPSARHTRVRKLKTLIVSANDIDAAVTIGFSLYNILLRLSILVMKKGAGL